MATQSVTVSRTAATGASKTSGMPRATQPQEADYTLTDLELLGLTEAAQAEEPQAETEQRATRESGSKEGKGTAETQAGEASPAKTPETAQQKNEGAESAHAELQEYAPAFALPGIGAKLREICEREGAYRQAFPTVEEAHAVREVFADAAAARASAAAESELARLDALVESRDPRAHAELLAGLARLAPQSIRSLALAFAEQLPSLDQEAYGQVVQALASRARSNPAPASAGNPPAAQQGTQMSAEPAASTAAQRQAAQVHAAEAAKGFLEAVNTEVGASLRATVAQKVEDLLPDAPEGARQKISGEVFRELDLALRADPELQEDVREAVRLALASGRESFPERGAWRGGESQGSGARATGDMRHQESVARLITRRARAALPSVAKRVVADWSETVLRSSQARRARQSEALSRTEIGRGGAPAPVPAVPRRVDYSRMSDEEILNME